MCLLSFGWVLSTKFARDLHEIFCLSLLGVEGRFICVWHCLIFFRRRILILLTWNWSHFVPNSVDILTWNFRKKLFRENFLEFFFKSRRLYQNLWNLPLLSAILFWVRLPLKKFTQGLSYVVCTLLRRYIHKQIMKRRYGEENPGCFVFGKPVLVALSLGLSTPYSLGILVWRFSQTFVIVSIEFCVRFDPNSSHKICSIFFVHHCQSWKKGLFVCEIGWFFSQANTHPFYLKFVAFRPKFSRDSYVKFQEKTISGKVFRIFVQIKATLYQNLWNLALLSAILFSVHFALKKFTQVLSYVFCTQVRRNIHKQIKKRRYGEEKLGRFVFGKLVLFTLNLRLTTSYSLGILVWNFYQTFVIGSIEFWVRFEPQIHSTRFAVYFLFIIARAGRKVRLCVKLLVFFSQANTHPFEMKLVTFRPKFSWNSYVEFQEKSISGEFIRIFVQIKAILP